MKPMRILILGNPGSGKTSLAKKLSQKTGIPWKDLDDFVWKRRFDISRPRPERRKMLARVLAQKQWILPGTNSDWNISAVARADQIIILQLPLLVETYRILKRFILRKLKHDSSKERLRGVLQLIWWDFIEFHVIFGKKKHFIDEIKNKYGLKVRVLTSQNQIDEFSDCCLINCTEGAN